MRRSAYFLALPAAALALGFMPGNPAKADAVADFYKKKRLTLYVGFSAGGGYDRYSRALGRRGTPAHQARRQPSYPHQTVDTPGADDRQEGAASTPW